MYKLANEYLSLLYSQKNTMKEKNKKKKRKKWPTKQGQICAQFF